MLQEQAPKEAQGGKKRKVKVTRVVNGIDQEVEVEIDDDGSYPVWGKNNAHRLLNKPITRVDAPVKVTGKAQYTYDVRVPGMLYGRILTAPHAHARVKRIDASALNRMPGVKAVMIVPGEAVVEGTKKASAEADKKNPTEVGGKDVKQEREAGKVIRFEGEPVAAIAATSPEIAEDAIRLIVVEYERLPHVVKAGDAMNDASPKVYPEGNVEDKEKRGDQAQVRAECAKCDAIYEAEFSTPIIHHACLETHGIVVDYRGGDTATIYASTQGTFTIPGDAAKELKLAESNVVAIVEHMGGGFGAKFGIGAEGKLACQLSKQTGAPVKMMLTRRQEFTSAGNRSGSWQRIKAGAMKDGTLVALEALQHRLGGLGDGSQAGQPYIYKVANSYRDVRVVHTHEDASRAMRAPGHPQAAFAMESTIDELAYKIGLNPLEMRKRNLTDKVYHRQLDRGAREIGWERWQAEPDKGRTLRRGMGCGIGTWGGGGNDQCKVDLSIGRDGAITVSVGSQDLGTGTRTYMRAIVAEELGLETSDIIERIGDSRLGAANASGGSTTAASLAPAVKDAALKASQLVAARVAPLLGIKPEEVRFADGKVMGGAASGKSLTWRQACATLPAAGVQARGVWKPNLQASGVHGVCFAEVEVDMETGKVRPLRMIQVQDVGLPLNRLGVESQVNGGMIQSLGMALWEGRVMDRNLGVMLNSGFGDYKIPGTLEMPEMRVIIDDEDLREAVIGVGESANIPSLGAVANAVRNACGVRVTELPITPDKVLMALMQKETTEGGARA